MGGFSSNHRTFPPRSKRFLAAFVKLFRPQLIEALRDITCLESSK